MEDERFDLLRQYISAFVSISEEDWGLLLPALSIKKIKRHQLFSETGKKADEVAFVLEGAFRQYYIRDGEERTTYFFFENHLLSSYISCITGSASLISIEALTNGSYISFSYKSLEKLFDQSMAWQKFGRLIAQYLVIGLEQRMAGLLLQSPEERYLELLSGGKKKIIERVPQHYIANYLGITSVSMSRIRNRVRKK